MIKAVTTTESTLIVYTRPDCSYSGALKDELDADGVTYVEVDLAAHPERESEMMELTGGERITPVMVEGSVVTVGYRGVG
jgi:glutaredoxin